MTSTHAPSHARLPLGHAHWLPVHCCDAAHVAPHAPQSWTSLVRSTQPFWQAVSVAVHDDAHTPRLQNGVAPAHATAQAPQFAGSEARGVQAPPQASSPSRTQLRLVGEISPSAPLGSPGKSSELVPPQAPATIANASAREASRASTYLKSAMLPTKTVQ